MSTIPPIANSLDRSKLTLQPGDQVSAKEFHRLNMELPEGTNAELIEGVVYMAAAVKLDHGQPQMFLAALMTQYCFDTPGVDYADNVTHQLDDENEAQPDLSLFIRPENGGQVSITDDGYLLGGPELVAEIAVSSVAIDRGPKRRVYEKNGVKEYIIWRVTDQIMEWYVRRESGFELMVAGEQGILRSEAFPGLWIDVAATLRRDGPTAMRVLNEGLQSIGHRTWVGQLRQ